MWPFKSHKELPRSKDDNRPIKVIKVGFNTWQIVYADTLENKKEN
jgi:hypothetical protein